MELRATGSERVIRFPVQHPCWSMASRDIPVAVYSPAADGFARTDARPLLRIGEISTDPVWLPEPGGAARITYDLPGLLYWALARCEELGDQPLDRYDRFPASASHAFAHGYLERPVVDEWLEFLNQAADRVWPSLHRVTTRGFRMIPSHDVDQPSRYAMRPFRGFARAVVDDVLVDRDLRRALQGVSTRVGSARALRTSDPANTFDWIMRTSEARRVSSTFFFICGRTAPRMDAGYDPEDPPIRSLMRNVHERGHEIGLHPSFGSFRSQDAIRREADRLRKICVEESIHQSAWGARMHFLRYSHPTTLRALSDAGFTYDTTLGYADRIGFRCGTCHEYPGFDPIEDRALSIRVRPLIVMDCSVTDAPYMGLGTGAAALDAITRVKAACRAVGGDFTILWHNSELVRADQRALYEAALDA